MFSGPLFFQFSQVSGIGNCPNFEHCIRVNLLFVEMNLSLVSTHETSTDLGKINLLLFQRYFSTTYMFITYLFFDKP